jgi:hypothetical protein
MPEHEPLDIASRDADRKQKPEARAARDEGTLPDGLDTPARDRANIPSDDSQIASEPMELQRLPNSDPNIPPGRQRTGDPPAPARREHGD